jgi:RNA polymerase sigma-70 factor (ECF subfamily)
MGSMALRSTRLLARARQAHPSFAVDGDEFRRHLLDALARRGDRAAGGADLHAADLYLSFACLRGDRRALARFDRLLLEAAELAFGALGRAGVEREEALQRSRQRLLAPERGAPKLASYAGRGPLKPWLRACVARVALNLAAGRLKAEVADEDAWLSCPSADDDPELALVRRTHAEEVCRAVADAVGALSPADRALLRQHYLDGLSPERLGELHGVHFVTIYRRLERVRRDLIDAAKRHVDRNVPLLAYEIEDLADLLRRQLGPAPPLSSPPAARAPTRHVASARPLPSRVRSAPASPVPRSRSAPTRRARHPYS